MIRVISSSNVVPNCSGGERLELTPSDLRHLLEPPIQACLIFQQRPESRPMDSTVEHLKATLSHALDVFYPLAGRLTVSDDSYYSVDCGAGNGVPFVHAAAAGGVTVADLLSPPDVPRELLRPFYPMSGQLSCHGVSEPLLAVQVTEIVDGVVLGVAANYVAADGGSFWRFVNTWSHIARGRPAPPPVPVFDRRGLFDGVFDLPIRLKKLPTLPDWALSRSSPVTSRMFRFSKEAVAELKAKANSAGGGWSISSFQAVMAHLWVSVTRSRGLDPAEEVCYVVGVGLRPRTDPPLPEGYFGNAVRLVEAWSTAEEILAGQGGFVAAARKLSDAISAQTPAEVRHFLAESAREPAVDAKVPRNALVTLGSLRFDVFGNDFGWGPPVAVRTNSGCQDGVMKPRASPAGDGSANFEVTLFTHTLHALTQDPEFAGRVSSV